MEFLIYSLPEEVLREEMLGNFSVALKLIDDFLKKDLPLLQRERLIYEKERIERLLEDYPFTEKEAMEKMREMFEGFSEGEFQYLMNEGVLDYIVVEGEKRFERRFFHNLAFVRSEYRERLRKDERSEKARRILHERLERLIKGEDPKRYRIRARITLKLKETSSKHRVWLPFPKESLQIESVKLLRTSHKSYYISPNDVPQRTIYFEGEDSTFFVEFEYIVREWVNHVDPERVSEKVAGFEEFLKEEPPHIVFTPKLRWLTQTVVGSEVNPYLKAKRIYDWITLNVRYSYVKPYALYENITDFVVNNLKGDCGFQALLFITMCRIAGVPARWQSGWYINPIFGSPHDWALFYVEPYGWLPADLSFGGARRDNESFRSFYFGNLDGFRMVANDGFMKDFDPKTRFVRSDPTDNQVGEAESEEKRLPFESTIEVISFEEV